METEQVPVIEKEVPVIEEKPPVVLEQTSAGRQQPPVIRRAWRRKFALTLIRIRDVNHFMDGNYNAVLKDVMRAKTEDKRSYEQEKRLKAFDFRMINGRPRLIANLPNETREYLKLEEIFDYLVKCDIATNHEGFPALKKETDRVYANVTNAMLEMYIAMCEMCHRKMKSKNLISNKILRLEVNSRGHFVLVSKQTDAAGIYNFILLYQDEETKFTLLRSIESRSVKHVAAELKDIFSIVGAPCSLNTNEAQAYLKQVIEELHIIWPGLRILIGKPTSNMTENVVNVTLRRVKEMIAKHVTEHPKSDWSTSLRFVQFQFNKEHHNKISRTPYEAMFGVKRREGLITVDLPPSMMNKLTCEEDFKKYLEDSSRVKNISKNKPDSQSDEDEQDEAKRPRIE